MTLSAVLKALLIGGLPLFLLTLAVVSWALHTRRLSGESVKALQASMQALGKAQKDKKQRQDMDPVMDKWLKFGGGFYGLVALYTWLLIEWEDVASFARGLWDIAFSLNLGAVIGLVIELFIESIMNFVMAIAWPAYWLSHDRNPWLLLAAAYGGYWLGIKVARQVFSDKFERRADDAEATKE